MNRLKNNLLLSTIFLAQLHTLFYGSKLRVDWYFAIDFARRIDYAVMNLTTSLNMLIISYCLYKPKGINSEIKKFIFIICILDLIHYFSVSKLQFGLVKIFLAIFIWLALYIKKNPKKVKSKIINTYIDFKEDITDSIIIFKKSFRLRLKKLYKRINKFIMYVGVSLN